MEKIKQYVQFIFDNGLCTTEELKEIPDRETHLQAPEHCESYRFFEMQETVARDGEILVGKPRNYSKMYYIGTATTLDAIETDVRCGRIMCGESLIFHLERSNPNKIVKTTNGRYLSIKEEDVIVPPK